MRIISDRMEADRLNPALDSMYSTHNLNRLFEEGQNRPLTERLLFD